MAHGSTLLSKLKFGSPPPATDDHHYYKMLLQQWPAHWQHDGGEDDEDDGSDENDDDEDEDGCDADDDGERLTDEQASQDTTPLSETAQLFLKHAIVAVFDLLTSRWPCT